MNDFVLTAESAGLVPSPPDTRDIPLDRVFGVVELPTSYVVPTFATLPVNNQQKQPSCVAQASSKIKEYEEKHELGFEVPFSPQWLFAVCKKLDGYPGWGTYLRIACKVLEEYGVCPLITFPDHPALTEDAYKDWTKLPSASFDAAKPYRIKGYARITGSTLDAYKQAMFLSGPVLAGLTLSNEGWKQSKVRPPEDGEQTYGHAVVLYGWDGDDLLGRNSWGNAWGDQGNFRLGKEYAPHLFEGWTFVDLPTELIHEAKAMLKTIKVADRPEIYAVVGGERFWVAPYRMYEFGVEKKFLAPFVEVTLEELQAIPEGGLITKF